MVFVRGRGGGRGGGGFRGNRGNSRGGSNSSSRFGSGGGGRGSGRSKFEQGPPDRVIPLGFFSYPCEDDLICKVEIDDVPYFNAPIYLENMEQIGKVDEIFGTVRDYSVSVKLVDNIKATSFKPSQKLFIDPGKLLPIARFLPKPPQLKIGGKKKGVSGKVGDFRGTKPGNRGGGTRGSGFGRGGGGPHGGSSFNKGGSGGGRGGLRKYNGPRGRW